MIKDQEKLNKYLWIMVSISILFTIIFAFPIFVIPLNTKNILAILLTIVISIIILKKEPETKKL